MKKFLHAAFLFIAFAGNAQLRGGYNQYMLNQGVYNPGYLDIDTRYSVTASFRRQWLSSADAPLTVSANGHYSITRNHGVAMSVINDQIDNVNTLDIGGTYTYHAWLNKKVALGMGIKMGYQQRSIQNNYVYFSETEPTLNQLKTGGFNMGAGLSIQSQNFDFGISLPFLFNNRYGSNTQIYGTQDNHFYSNIGYKVRFSDYFIVYPSILVRGVAGAPLNMSFDGHILYNQLFWFGGGYRSDNTASASVGVFLDNGLRILYSYESSYFSPHKRLESSHEITLNYARTIKDLPFTKRTYTVRKGGKFRKSPRRRYN